MNKKGQGFKMVDYITKLIFLVASTFAIAYLISFSVVLSIQTEELRAEIFAKRILYSPTGITYVDPVTNRPYPNIIDSEKFSSGFIETSIDSAENSLIAAKLELEYDGKKKEAYYGEARYQNWMVGVFKGDNERKELEIPVVVYDNGFRNGMLRADILAVKG